MSKIDSVKELYIQLGASLLTEGKYEEAERIYRQAIELESDHAWVNCNLGRALLHQGKIEEAIPYLQTAVKLEPNMAEAYYNLGNAYTKQNSFEEAVGDYRKAIELEPGNFLYCHHLGDVFLIQQQYEEAVNHYHKAIELNSDYAWSYCNLGKALSELGQWEKARAAYKQAIELNPEVPSWVYENLGNILSRQNKEEILDKPVKSQFTNDIDKDCKLTNQDRSNLLEFLLSQLRIKFNGARNKLLELIRREGKVEVDNTATPNQSTELNSSLAENYFALGEKSLLNNNFNEAINFFQQATQSDKSFGKAYHKLGDILSKQDKLDEAISMYCKAILLNSQAGWSYHNLASILDKQAKQKEAIAALQQAVESDPTSARFCHSLADMLMKQKHLNEAMIAYRYAINLNSNNPWVYYNLAKGLQLQGNYLEAALFCVKSLQLKKDFPESLKMLKFIEDKVAIKYCSGNLKTINPFQLDREDWEKTLQNLSETEPKFDKLIKTIATGSVSKFLYAQIGDYLLSKNYFNEGIYSFMEASKLCLSETQVDQITESSINSLISSFTLSPELASLNNITGSHTLGIPW